MDYQYFKDHYNSIAVDVSKQNELDADSRAIEQIELYGMLKTNLQVCTVVEKSKETMNKGTLQRILGTAKQRNSKSVVTDRNDLPHELLLITRQKTKLINALNNNMSTDLKLSKAQISKILQSGGFLESLLRILAGSLMKVAIPLAKNVLAPLGITAAASAIDAGIQKKIHGSGTTTLIISNEEMNDIMKIVQALEDSNVLLKGVTKRIKNETKEQKGGFLSMLLGTWLVC